MRKYGFDIDAVNRNEEGEKIYLVDGTWNTAEELKRWRAELDYWDDWADEVSELNGSND